MNLMEIFTMQARGSSNDCTTTGLIKHTGCYLYNLGNYHKWLAYPDYFTTIQCNQNVWTQWLVTLPLLVFCFFQVLVLRAYPLQDVAAQMPVVRHSSCCCHHTEYVMVSPISVLAFLCFFFLLPFLALVSSLNHCGK